MEWKIGLPGGRLILYWSIGGSCPRSMTESRLLIISRRYSAMFDPLLSFLKFLHIFLEEFV
jgi:hypothetical protein